MPGTEKSGEKKITISASEDKPEIRASTLG
jgi:hypothetical protein